MPDEEAVAEAPRDGTKMTPAQSNEVICEKLTHLRPAYERVCFEMDRLKDDLENGRFNPIKLVRKVLQRLG